MRTLGVCFEYLFDTRLDQPKRVVDSCSGHRLICADATAFPAKVTGTLGIVLDIEDELDSVVDLNVFITHEDLGAAWLPGRRGDERPG